MKIFWSRSFQAYRCVILIPLRIVNYLINLVDLGLENIHDDTIKYNTFKMNKFNNFWNILITNLFLVVLKHGLVCGVILKQCWYKIRTEEETSLNYENCWMFMTRVITSAIPYIMIFLQFSSSDPFYFYEFNCHTLFPISKDI